MGKDIVASVIESTAHTDPSRFALMIALAWHAWDQDFTGRVTQSKLRETSRLTARTFRRALHDIECSQEVIFYDRPGKSPVYFMFWAYDIHETDAGRKPVTDLVWPQQFQDLGEKCPRPTRRIWTDEHADRIILLHQVSEKRREIKRKRKQASGAE